MIKKCEFDFPSPYWDDVSDMAKELIKSLLVVDPSKRLNGEQIAAHPWIKGEDTPRKELPNFNQQMRAFNAKRKFKVLISFNPNLISIENWIFGHGSKEILEHS